MADSNDEVPYKAYRDASVPIDQRVDDLLERMTLEEKAGQLFHDMMMMGPGGTLSQASTDLVLLVPKSLLVQN